MLYVDINYILVLWHRIGNDIFKALRTAQVFCYQEERGYNARLGY